MWCGVTGSLDNPSAAQLWRIHAARPNGAEIVVGPRKVEFVDRHALAVLDDAGRSGPPVTIRHAGSMLRKLLGLLCDRELPMCHLLVEASEGRWSAHRASAVRGREFPGRKIAEEEGAPTPAHQKAEAGDMPVRTASAHWEGVITDGCGSIKVSSCAVDAPYSFGSRFEERAGTNPEELLGAALAGCYTMALALGLSESGHPPERVDTTARVSIEREACGFRITRIVLRTEAAVAGIDAAEFQTVRRSCQTVMPGFPRTRTDPDRAGRSRPRVGTPGLALSTSLFSSKDALPTGT